MKIRDWENVDEPAGFEMIPRMPKDKQKKKKRIRKRREKPEWKLPESSS